MDKIQASYIKIVAAGGDLDAAAQMNLATDKVVLTATPEIVEHIITRSPFPEERIEIGTGFGIKGVLADGTHTELIMLLGGADALNIYTKTQGVRTLPKYDIRLGIYRPSDGAVKSHDLTDMNFIAAVEMGFEQKKKAYLPFEAVGTDTSDLTIEND